MSVYVQERERERDRERDWDVESYRSSGPRGNFTTVRRFKYPDRYDDDYEEETTRVVRRECKLTPRR